MSGVPSSCAIPEASLPTVDEPVGVPELLERRDPGRVSAASRARRREPIAHDVHLARELAELVPRPRSIRPEIAGAHAPRLLDEARTGRPTSHMPRSAASPAIVAARTTTG